MTLEKADSDTKIFLAASAGIQPGTSSSDCSRGKCLATELPHYHLHLVRTPEFAAPSQHSDFCASFKMPPV